jgi:hypothetical protein
LAQFSHSTEDVAVRSSPALTPAKRRSFAPIQTTLPSIRVTQRRLKQLEGIHLVREQREHGKQDLAFHDRPFVLCGLPLRRLPSDQLTYLRRNGKFFLQLVAHPQFGMPYGQDRLIPIWIENGRSTPTLQVLERLANALGVELHELLTVGHREPEAPVLRERITPFNSIGPSPATGWWKSSAAPAAPSKRLAFN